MLGVNIALQDPWRSRRRQDLGEAEQPKGGLMTIRDSRSAAISRSEAAMARVHDPQPPVYGTTGNT